MVELRRSLRARLAVVVGVGVGACFAAAGWITVEVVEARLRDGLESEIERALDTAERNARGGADPADVVTTPGEPQVQLVEAPSTAPLGGRDGIREQRIGDATILFGRRTVIGPDGQTLALIATAPLDDANTTVRLFRASAVAVTFVSAVVMAALAWFVTGRALRPVERLRLEANRIRNTASTTRLSRPGTAAELDHLADTLNDMLDRMADASRRQHEFVSDASHELRSPVTTIRAAVELHRRGDNAALDVVPPELERLEHLVDDLLTLARLDEPTHAVPAEDVDLDDIVRQHASTLRSVGASIDTSRVEVVKVHGSPTLLSHAVRNLLDNAHRHATRQVTVILHDDDGHAVLHVDDDGPGVPPDRRTAIFERFTRLDHSRTRHRGGGGLGLAVVKAAVDAHAGSVTCDDSPAGGARFTISIPTSNL